MFNLRMVYEIDETLIAEKIVDTISDEIFDATCSFLDTHYKIDVDCISDEDFDKIQEVVAKKVCEMLLEEKQED